MRCSIPHATLERRLRRTGQTTPGRRYSVSRVIAWRASAIFQMVLAIIGQVNRFQKLRPSQPPGCLHPPPTLIAWSRGDWLIGQQ